MTMNRINLVFLFFLVHFLTCPSNSVNCQSLLNLDSLMSQLEFQKDDTNKVKLLLNISLTHFASVSAISADCKHGV